MRVALAAAVCLALSAVACTAVTPSPRPSQSLPLTDLSSVRLPTPTSTPTATLAPANGVGTPAATRTDAPTSTPSSTATAPPTPIELTPTPTPSTLAATLGPSATPVSSSTGSVAPASPAGATPAADCVNGWLAPAAGSPEYELAFEMIDSQMGTTGPWTIDEMRYFTGPDVPWILDPHYDVVDYWYAKASRVDDPLFHARWLLEQRTEEVRGISAVAPYDTIGYASPDWTAFEGDGAPQIYAGLPGTWSGVPYDFVTGEGDSGQPGLPDEVVGCLSRT